ncbi:alpha-amylase family glycosyl hydrolase [Alteromonas sp. a30]|uniref:alpha-amylase family glycosyl hydrolase n=1 Tax=Alteromonas sp. a30 TaxID=2730917 RepID=UPI003FA3CF0F
MKNGVDYKDYLSNALRVSSSLLKSNKNKDVFEKRLAQHFPRLFNLLFDVYGERYDFAFYINRLTCFLCKSFIEREDKLKSMDAARQGNADWFQQETMLGIAVYVDLFAGDLVKLQSRISYLQELGVTYLHLMPLYAVPEGESDGGYAVSDYRKVNPALGNMNDLKRLADSLREAGISLVLDFVFNHTADDHAWAKAAKSGDTEFQNYYWMFDDKSIPERYEENLREIFPQVRRGNFTFNNEANKWVWTTFNSFQWDLNYSNPAVFNAIVEEMLFLANVGCEVLRLDALAFIWKEMGTNCENQPKAHALIQAFNACLKIVAPAVSFKSEAIVHPDEVAKYIAPDECQLSYNPLLMALLWESLATRQTELLTKSMQKSFAIDADCTWVNYVRCHDDVGWTFDDAVSAQCGINGYDHRYFLNQFYTGRFEGSFAKGVAFQENPSTGDCRVCGSAASLAGLEQGLIENNELHIEHAIQRVLLLHSVILSIGGIPLLYAGDELGVLNDYRYLHDPHKQQDSRWVNRIAHSEEVIQQAQNPEAPQNRIAQGLQKLIGLRKQYPVLGKGSTHIITTDNPHLFAYHRQLGQNNVLVMCNFSESTQQTSRLILGYLQAEKGEDLISGKHYALQGESLELQPYQVMWIKA